MKKITITSFLTLLYMVSYSQNGEDWGYARHAGSSAYGLNINTPTDATGNGLYNGTFTNMQFAMRAWSGSHAILFNSFASQTMVPGGLNALGNTKYANNVGSYSSGAGAIMFFGNGGNMDFLISPNSTGQNSDVNWGTTKMRIQRNGNIGIGTTTPDERLSVAGNIKATGTVNVEGNQIRFSEARGIDYDPAKDAIFYNGYNNGQVAMLSDRDGNSWFGGNVGIGTTTPENNLHIMGSGEQTIAITSLDSTPKIHLRRHNTGYDGMIMFHEYGRMGFHLDGSNAGGVTTNEFVSIVNSGNVGIGTTTPTEKLEVNGTIRSKEVKVEASPWPDYVFADNYKLLSLEALEKFIQSEGHLPEVPSAVEVEENGIALGEMNALLLKKIEELTLYTIEQQKEIQNLLS